MPALLRMLYVRTSVLVRKSPFFLFIELNFHFPRSAPLGQLLTPGCSSLPNEGTKCLLTIGDYKVRIRIFLQNALEATLSIRHIAFASVSTDSTSLKLQLKPV